MVEWERPDGWASDGAQGQIFARARRPGGNAARETLNSAATPARVREHGGRLRIRFHICIRLKFGYPDPNPDLQIGYEYIHFTFHIRNEYEYGYPRIRISDNSNIHYPFPILTCGSKMRKFVRALACG
jgi:hypothetical protein